MEIAFEIRYEFKELNSVLLDFNIEHCTVKTHIEGTFLLMHTLLISGVHV